MKKILVATDFTYPAMNALDYAIEFSKNIGGHIHLIHANDLTDRSTIAAFDGENIKSMVEKITEENFTSELKRVKSIQGNVPIDTHFVVGEIVDVLASFIEKGDVYLTIMGTTGQNKSGFLWGSKSLNAMRHLNGPILLIPRTATYEPINKIMLTMDIDKLNAEFPFEMVSSWVQDQKATLDILNVQSLDPFIDNENDSMLSNFSNIDYQLHTMESDDLSEAVSYYIAKNNPNWLMVIPKRYGFFKSLFHKSQSEIISKASTIPVLAIHQ